AGAVLLRARGDRPGLAAAGRGVPDRVRRRDGDVPPAGAADPSPELLPAERAQPRLAGQAQPAVAAGGALPARLGGADPDQGAGLEGVAQGLVHRVLGRAADLGRRAPSDGLEDGLAHGETGQAPDRVKPSPVRRRLFSRLTANNVSLRLTVLATERGRPG